MYWAISASEAAGYMMCRPEEVDYALEISRNEHNEGDDSGEDKSWRGSEAPHMGHGQDVWLKEKQQKKEPYFLIVFYILGAWGFFQETNTVLKTNTVTFSLTKIIHVNPVF